MRMKIFAVKDLAVGAFMRPFVLQTNAVAIRSFSDEVNRDNADNSMFHHPEDYELWLLGEFDDLDPPYVRASDPSRVASALDMKMPSGSPR